jgi:hypothetical protein
MARRWVRRIGRITIAIIVALALRWAIWSLWRRLAPPIDAEMVLAVVVAAAALLAAIWWLWWRLPQRQVAKLALKIRDPKARADTEDNFRKTVGQALGGIAVLIGAGAAYLQFTQQQRTATEQIITQQKIAAEQIAAQKNASDTSSKASQDLLISNQVAKGFEQLASDKMTMRLGGIYALEGVMNTSDQYHQPVLEALCAFVRESTKPKTEVKSDKGPSGPPKVEVPATDVLAALTVIGRRKPGAGNVILVAVNITGVNLSGADLSGANLVHAKLSGADLFQANLSRADLIAADLTGATLGDANLSGATLGGANLSGANLSGANLSDTSLDQVDLSRADLNGANLSDAISLTQDQLDQACGKPKALPQGLNSDKLKPCPL